MKNKKEHHKIEYIVEYGGLSTGEHTFEFDIDNAFMQQYQSEPSENQYSVNVQILLIKYNHSVQVKLNLKGSIKVQCDKCLIPFDYPIDFSADLLVQEGNPENSTDEILMVEKNDNKINFSQYLYETLALAIPYKIVPCEEFDNVSCDQQVLKNIQQNLSEKNKSLTFAELFKNKLKP